MSIKTWEAIYYPNTAKQASKNALSALDHSILKWSGLNKSILKAHEIRRKHYDDDTYELLGDSSGKDFWVDSDTCALCVYDTVTRESLLASCAACPIEIITGDDCDKEYSMFIDNGDPKPMQKLLKKVLKQYLKEEKKKK